MNPKPFLYLACVQGPSTNRWTCHDTIGPAKGFITHWTKGRGGGDLEGFIFLLDTESLILTEYER